MRVNVLVYVELEVETLEQASTIADWIIDRVADTNVALVGSAPARIVAVNADDPEELEVPSDDTDIPF